MMSTKSHIQVRQDPVKADYTWSK